MRTYVINMRSQTERRRGSRDKFDALGLEFFGTIAGPAAIAAHDAEELPLDTGRSITIGKVGCFVFSWWRFGWSAPGSGSVSVLPRSSLPRRAGAGVASRPCLPR